MAENANDSAAAAGAGDESWFENAVLVYGPRKGGTTLLQNLLDGGEGLFVYPVELKLKQLVFAKLDDEGGAAIYARRSRIRTVTIPRFDQARYKAAMDEQAQRGEVRGLKRLIRSDLAITRGSMLSPAVAAPRQWAAKEVGGRTSRIVEWWLANFDNPRVVFIVRDPLMVTRAVLRTRRRTGDRQSLADLLYETFDPRRVMRAQQALLDRPNVYAVAYEDLVADPEAAMARIAGFLGVPHGPHLARPSIFGESVVVATASKKSRDVFADQAGWSDGLSLRERIVVRLATLFAAVHPGLRLDYAALRARLKRQFG